MMRYVSEAKMYAMFESEGYSTELADIVIGEISEELPAPQWQTLEEFKENPIEGWCHIIYDHSTEVAYYNECRFFFKDNSVVDSDDTWNIDHISYVQPILTPEAPE